jgi:Secretion system C-terminal sorting domain
MLNFRNKCSIKLLALMLVLCVGTAHAQAVFINEFHYDNIGTDVGEFVEIAGPSGTNLTGWSVIAYNGGDGASYLTGTLSGTIPNQSNGFGTVSVLMPVIQNGAPDGIALVNNGVLVQFLSYVGTFTGTNGPANGVRSVDVGVTESSSNPAGSSIRLTGSGSTYTNFTWKVVTSGATPGAINAGQTFAATLPVTYLNFGAKYQTKNQVAICWQTASETNNKGFQIERLMVNGDWATLGFVNAKGKAATYDFTDKTPLSTSYYRLRQIDFDGKETLSKVVVVENDKSKGVSLRAFPNPVRDILYLETDNDTDFEIRNLLGQTVLRGGNATQINVATLPEGTYLLRVGAAQVKFVKQ